MTASQSPPNSPEAERGAIGCCLVDPESIDECADRFKAGPAVFYLLANRKIYENLLAMRSDGVPIDIITLQSRLKASGILDQIGGIPYLAACQDATPSAANLPTYAEILTDKHRRRQLLKTCLYAAEKVYEDNDATALVGKVENALYGIETDASETVHGKALAVRLINHMERRFTLHNEGKHSGLMTGFHRLDSLTDGLQPGEQTIIGARPSIGKTALAGTFVDRVCLTDQIPTVFVTYEMSIEAITRRMFCARCSVPMDVMKQGNLTEHHVKQFTAFNGLLKSSPLYMVDAVDGMDANQLTAKLRRLWRRHGIKLVVVDYLQKVAPPKSHEKRTYEIAQVSSILKSFAVHTGVALVTLAQLNRESERERANNAPRPPRITDLGDSGSIERDADCIGLLHRNRDPDAAVNGIHPATLFIAKQRDGELGAVQMDFEGRFCRFSNQTHETV